VQDPEQDVGEQVRVEVRPGRRDQAGHVLVPEPVDGVRLAAGGRGAAGQGRVVLGGQQADVPGSQADHAVGEGHQPGGGRGPRPERRGTGGGGHAERLGAFGHQGLHQPGPAAEPVEHGGLAHARLGRHPLDRDLGGLVAEQQILGGLQDRAPVPRRIGPFGTQCSLVGAGQSEPPVHIVREHK
jgi:hypothetical protein